MSPGSFALPLSRRSIDRDRTCTCNISLKIDICTSVPLARLPMRSDLDMMLSEIYCCVVQLHELRAFKD